MKNFLYDSQKLIKRKILVETLMLQKTLSLELRNLIEVKANFNEVSKSYNFQKALINFLSKITGNFCQKTLVSFYS